VGGAARLLGALRAAVVQAPGGVPELPPDKQARVTIVDGGVQAEPVAFDGVALDEPAPEALPVVARAADLAELVREVVAGGGPASARRAAILGAALILWTAGLAPAPQDAATLARLRALLSSGAAGRALAGAAACYS
jgi:anthranilate phosphoribosyltransferase